MRTIITILAMAGALLTGACAVPAEPTPVQPAEKGAAEGKSKKAKAPIGLAAKRTKARPTMLADGGPMSCVRVTVTNRSKKVVEVNPLYFSLTGTDGVKRDTAMTLGSYEGQVPTTSLAPGEKAKGVVCASGKFKPKTISMTNELFSTAARAEVS